MLVENATLDEAVVAIDGLLIGGTTDLWGFGIIAQSYRVLLIKTLEAVPAEIPWQEHVLQTASPKISHDIFRAVELGRDFLGRKANSASARIKWEVQKGLNGVLLERMIAMGINRRVSTLIAEKTPSHIDVGWKDKPGIDVYIRDTQSELLWWGLITKRDKRRKPINHAIILQHDLKKGARSRIWYREKEPLYPSSKIPTRFFSIFLKNMRLPQDIVMSDAFEQWEKKWFHGELHDFLPNPIRERFSFFLNRFSVLWNLHISTDREWRSNRILEQGARTPVEHWNITRTIVPCSHCSHELFLDYPKQTIPVCTLDLPLQIDPARIDDTFQRNIKADMEAIGWK